jgi:hypothetical protein
MCFCFAFVLFCLSRGQSQTATVISHRKRLARKNEESIGCVLLFFGGGFFFLLAADVDLSHSKAPIVFRVFVVFLLLRFSFAVDVDLKRSKIRTVLVLVLRCLLGHLVVALEHIVAAHTHFARLRVVLWEDGGGGGGCCCQSFCQRTNTEFATKHRVGSTLGTRSI